MSTVNYLNSTIQPTKLGYTTSTSYEFAPVQGEAKYICYVFYGLVLFFGVFGNITVFYVIGYRKKKRNSGDIYILSLACADFLASVTTPMVILNDLITDYSGWFYGEAMCYLLFPISLATICASGWSLVLISIDRYSIISKPMNRTSHRPMLFCSVALAWLSSIAVVVPSILQHELTNNVCWSTNYKIIPKKSSFIYYTVWAVYAVLIPNSILSCVYFLTARTLKANAVKHENNRAMQLRNKQNAEIVKMFVIIVMVYFVLTIPYAIFYIYACYLQVYDESNPDNQLINTMNFIMLIPASANGCVNPLIYAKMHREINGHLISIVQKLKRFCCHRNPMINAMSPAWVVFPMADQTQL